MTDSTIATRNSSQTGHLLPPRWMSRVEKREFVRVLEARKAALKPVLPGEFDSLCDYVAVRSRIAALRRLFKQQLADVGSFLSHQRHVAGLARQIDASTNLSRKLAADLHLNVQPTKGTQE